MPTPTTAIIQARFSSARLPGKVLADLEGEPLLGWLFQRLARCSGLAGVVLATSDDPSDDPVAAFARDRGVACYRGPLQDVAGRVLGAAAMAKAEAFVRITGDSPFMDPWLVDQAVRLFQAGDFDLVTNTQVRSYPKGMSVEVVRTASLERALRMTADPDDREHLTRWFYRHPQACRIVNFTSGQGLAEVQLSVDTPDDLAMARRIAGRLGGPQAMGDWRQVLAARDGEAVGC